MRYRTDASSEYITAYEYEYTSDGQIHSFKDNITSRITVYRYDGYDRLMGISEYEDSEDVIHTELSYDESSRIEAADTYISYSLVNGGVAIKNTEAIKYTYSYLDDGRLDEYTILGGFTVNAAYSYDDLDRIGEVEYNISENNLSIKNRYSYENSSNCGTSERVDYYESTVGNDEESYGYTYDGDGNITKIVIFDGGKAIEYTYDIYGRVTKEDNDLTGLSYTYTYDNAGNLTYYSYHEQIPDDSGGGGLIMGKIGDETLDTLAIKPLLPQVTTYTYLYTDSEWGDLLTSYNGTAITYDEIGNPLSYYNGSSYTFTWQGRRLMTATKGTKNMSFEYDIDGLRISKTVNGVTTNYIYDGDLLVAEYTDTKIVVYIYDANGSPIGFKYRANTYAQDVWDVYWYGKNLQGDIVAIYSSNGTKLINYTYNAWGVTTKSYSNGGASTTAIHNNLTYRGYYYDSNLSMYYLQSRYYDPVVCRFINADSLIDQTSIAGYNLFAYCHNNPVNMTDTTGNSPIAISIASIVLAACFALTIVLVATCVRHVSDDKEKNNSLSNSSDIDLVVNNSNEGLDSYTVYALKDLSTDKIEYVGRTKNPSARESAHKASSARGHLTFVVLEENLSKSEARGLEQYYMIFYHTVNASDKKNNQINGISLSNPMINIYVEATINYIGNMISNEFLNWAGV